MMKDCEEIREWYEEYRAPKEDSRIKFAKSELEKRGYEVTHDVANGVLRSHADACAEFCVEFAHALVGKLKEKEERK